MAQNDMLKRYLDAGMAFTNMTRDRAEAIVKDLVKAGDIRRKEAEQQIDELLERSRKNTEDLLELIRNEVAEQLRAVGLDDLAKRAGGFQAGSSKRAEGGDRGADSGEERPAEKAPAAKKSADKPAAAKPAAAKKSADKRAPAKKQSPAAKAPAPEKSAAKTDSVASKELPAKKQAGGKKQAGDKKSSASGENQPPA